MAKNRVFFPQEALDSWLVDGRVELTNDELMIRSEGRKFRITEAVRVLSELTNTPDLNDLVGRVKSRVFLQALEAEILEGSMIIGDNAYEVVPGFLGTPVGTFAEHVQSQSSAEARKSRPELAPPRSDEELLGQFLMQTL
jgi:hypothetical protein